MERYKTQQIAQKSLVPVIPNNVIHARMREENDVSMYAGEVPRSHGRCMHRGQTHSR